LKDEHFIVSLIARLEEVKGHRFLLESAAALNMICPDMRFLIAGTGSMENELIGMSRKMGLGDTVIFTGFIQDTAIVEHIMDIQVNASFGTEAASLSLLEGMSLGKPAVVSDFGGNPEIIKDGVNGYVVPQKNAQAMADKILCLLSDNKLSEDMSRQAADIFIKKYTARIMTEEMEKFYERIDDK